MLKSTGEKRQKHILSGRESNLGRGVVIRDKLFMLYSRVLVGNEM